MTHPLVAQAVSRLLFGIRLKGFGSKVHHRAILLHFYRKLAVALPPSKSGIQVRNDGQHIYLWIDEEIVYSEA